MISGETLLTGVFGDPVEHSRSPLMHNAAYRELGLDRVYLPFHVRSDQLRRALAGISALGLLGVNVTVPHKERAVAMVHSISNEGRKLGAINCVVNRSGRLFGDNTDARGLEADLRSFRLTIAGRRAIVIGAGGAGAAAILGISRLGARPIVVANRTRARALLLARRLRPIEPQVIALGSLIDPEIVGEAAIIINATAAGMRDSSFPALNYAATSKECFFYDVIYAREPTPFLRPARLLNRRSSDGRGMLVHQGALAFELFNRCGAPVEVMRAALLRSLSHGRR